MTPAYMPFTYLSAATADILAALLGPIVVYQPLESGTGETLAALAERGQVILRAPLVGDETRLAAALAEFTQWARLNPGKSTAGAGFISSRQGAVPFFDESTINQIRSDIKAHGKPTTGFDDDGAGFSARLFLAVAQANDRTTDHLDNDLSRFKAMEQDFLDSLDGADEAAFDRHATGEALWREDPGARQTLQRIRAWATLAAADVDPPDLLVTTSSAVVDALVEHVGDAIALETLATIRLAIPAVGEPPLLAAVFADLAHRPQLAAADLASFTALADPAAGDKSISVTLLAAVDHDPTAVIRSMAPAATRFMAKRGMGQSVHHTLILRVQN